MGRLAARLPHVLDRNLYHDIIMTRVTVSVGEDISFLSGTEEEKMPPRWGPVWTNLEVLIQTESDEWMGSSGNQ